MRIASDAPNTVRGAGVLVAAQGLTGLGFAVYFLVRGLEGGAPTGGAVFGEAAYFAVLGVAVTAAGVALVLGKHWARSPAIVVELLLLGVAWYAFGPSGRPEIGLPVALASVLVLSLLFSARSREWFLGLDEHGNEKTGQ